MREKAIELALRQAMLVAFPIHSQQERPRFACVCGRGYDPQARPPPDDIIAVIRNWTHMTQKPLFSSSDIRITTEKLQVLTDALRDLALDLDRIRVEVGLLRDANHAMAKTIKERRYADSGQG